MSEIFPEIPEKIEEIYEYRRRVLAAAFEQLDAAEPVTRHARGPWYDDVVADLQRTSQELEAVDPSLRPAHLFAALYQPEEIRKNEPTHLKSDIRRVKEGRFARLKSFADQVVAPALAQQPLPEGTFSPTPYHRTGEEEVYDDHQVTCTSAAFRMIFDGLMGWAPSERSLIAKIKDHYGTLIVDDEVYLKLFATKAFQEASQKKVVSIGVTGADFAFLAGLTTNRIRSGRPSTEVYCIANLGSRIDGDAYYNRWHKVVLKKTTKQGVIYNDPSRASGAEDKRAGYSMFAERWAVTNNSARLIIATPMNSSADGN